jgi:acyl-CoA thioester hydrolase
MTSKEKFLSDFPINVSIPVQWGDMDAAQHVNNTVYLRWAETGRIHFFDTITEGFSLVGDEVGVILGYQDCKYIFPVTYPDTVCIGMKMGEIKQDRFMLLVHIFSEKYQRLAAISNQTIVTYNYKALCKIDIPARFLEALEISNKIKPIVQL